MSQTSQGVSSNADAMREYECGEYLVDWRTLKNATARP